MGMSSAQACTRGRPSSSTSMVTPVLSATQTAAARHLSASNHQRVSSLAQLRSRKTLQSTPAPSTNKLIRPIAAACGPLCTIWMGPQHWSGRWLESATRQAARDFPSLEANAPDRSTGLARSKGPDFLMQPARIGQKPNPSMTFYSFREASR